MVIIINTRTGRSFWMIASYFGGIKNDLQLKKKKKKIVVHVAHICDIRTKYLVRLIMYIYGFIFRKTVVFISEGISAEICLQILFYIFEILFYTFTFILTKTCSSNNNSAHSSFTITFWRQPFQSIQINGSKKLIILFNWIVLIIYYKLN